MADHSIQSIGVVGLGRMGLPMAMHLKAAGFGVTGFDSQPSAMDSARAAGLEITANCAELAAVSDVVIVIVGFDRQVEEAVFGTDGVAAGARPGTFLLIASTVAPGFMKSLAERCRVLNLTALDIPVARGEAAAKSGRLLVFAGGDEDTIQRCKPLLESFAERIDYLGPAGAGQTAKAINNMLLWTCLAANVEGLDFGEAQGLDREALRDALRHSSGANWALETRADDRPALWAEKDMDLLLAEAEACGMAMPVSRSVRSAIAAFKKARGLPTPAPE